MSHAAKRLALLLAIVIAVSLAAACQSPMAPETIRVQLTIPSCPMKRPDTTTADSIVAICRYDSTGVWIGW